MNKDLLQQKIKEGNFNNKKDLIGWVKALPRDTKLKAPSKFKVGDVYMHPVFVHPYVLLCKSDTGWICGLLTSNGNFEEVLEKCRSRFFVESYFTKVLFTVPNHPIGVLMGVYDNTRHLKKIHIKLKNIFK